MKNNYSYFRLSILKDDKRIVFLFALYGLLAGIISYIATLSYDTHYMDTIASFINYPTVMIIFMTNPSGFSIEPSILPAAIILASIAVWSFIGFIVYLFAKLFKLKDNFP